MWDIANDPGDATPAALKAAAKLPPPAAGDSELSITARRFQPHLLAADAVPGAAVRPRADGQLAVAAAAAAAAAPPPVARAPRK